MASGQTGENVAMRKDVAEKIRGSGRKLAEPPREPAQCDFASLVDGFLVHVLELDTEEYRRAFWCEAYRNGHTIGHVPRTFNGFVRRNAHTPEEIVSLLLGVFVLFGAYSGTVFLLNWITRLVRVLRRPTYYEQERVRRRQLATVRRRGVSRRTLNPRPSYDAIRAALAAARTSPEAALRCGSLMMDLACFADASLRFDDCGHIVGRRGGVKRLLQREAPDLFGKYPTLMRHKAMAARFRQACGAEDPTPVDALLPSPVAPGGMGDTTARNGNVEVALPHQAGCDVTARNNGEGMPEVGPARDIAKEILGECEGTIISLEAALALRLDPDCIPVHGNGVDAKPERSVAANGAGARRDADLANACAVKRAVEWLRRRRVA